VAYKAMVDHQQERTLKEVDDDDNDESQMMMMTACFQVKQKEADDEEADRC